MKLLCNLFKLLHFVKCHSFVNGLLAANPTEANLVT